MSAFFKQYIEGNDYLDITHYLSKCSLELSTMLEEMYISPKKQMTSSERQLFEGIFMGK